MQTMTTKTTKLVPKKWCLEEQALQPAHVHVFDVEAFDAWHHRHHHLLLLQMLLLHSVAYGHASWMPLAGGV